MRHSASILLCCAAALFPLAAQDQPPLRSAAAPAFAWLTSAELNELGDSDPITVIDLRRDPLGTSTALPADHDEIVAIDAGRGLLGIAHAVAERLAGLGYRRVYILFNFGC
jgi:hypothetical protein